MPVDGLMCKHFYARVYAHETYHSNGRVRVGIICGDCGTGYNGNPENMPAWAQEVVHEFEMVMILLDRGEFNVQRFF